MNRAVCNTKGFILESWRNNKGLIWGFTFEILFIGEKYWGNNWGFNKGGIKLLGIDDWFWFKY